MMCFIVFRVGGAIYLDTEVRMATPHDRTAVSVRISLPSVEAVDEVAAVVEDWESAWVDAEGADAVDPATIGVIFTGISTGIKLVEFLVGLVKNRKAKTIPVTDKSRELILTINEDVSDEDIPALAEKLAASGQDDA